MSDQTIFIYGIYYGASLLLMVMGICFAFIMPGVDRWSKRFFTVFFSLIFFLCCFSLTEMLFYGVPGMDRVSVVANFGMSLCSVISLPMMTLFLLHLSG